MSKLMETIDRFRLNRVNNKLLKNTDEMQNCIRNMPVNDSVRFDEDKRYNSLYVRHVALILDRAYLINKLIKYN